MLGERKGLGKKQVTQGKGSRKGQEVNSHRGKSVSAKGPEEHPGGGTSGMGKAFWKRSMHTASHGRCWVTLDAAIQRPVVA